MTMKMSATSLAIHNPLSPNSKLRHGILQKVNTYIKTRHTIQFPTKLIYIAFFCRPNDLTMPFYIFFMQSGKQLMAIMSGMQGKNRFRFGVDNVLISVF